MKQRLDIRIKRDSEGRHSRERPGVLNKRTKGNPG